jgi:hypothetical protein
MKRSIKFLFFSICTLFALQLQAQKGELKLNISDILNQTQYFYQNTSSNTKFQKDSDAYRFTRKVGTTFSLSFNYSFLN